MDINISKQSDDIVIRFKATSAFVPAAFDGLPVTLTLGDGYEVPGVLRMQSAVGARGLWFPYAFLALRADDYNNMSFKGRWRWFQRSNVKSVRLEMERTKFMLNPCFKK